MNEAEQDAMALAHAVSEYMQQWLSVSITPPKPEHPLVVEMRAMGMLPFKVETNQ